LVEILTRPKNALVKQYQRLFEYEGVKLRFEDDALEPSPSWRSSAKSALVTSGDHRRSDAGFDVSASSSAQAQEFGVTKEMVSSNRIDLSLLEKAG